MGYVKELTYDNFKSVVLESALPVIVHFWAPWCGPCHQMDPKTEQIGMQYQGKLTVGRLDVDSYPYLEQKYGIAELPFFLLFQRGKPVDSVVGAHSDQLETMAAFAVKS